MNIVWNQVTWYSRLLAVIFFILVVPILTFYIGTAYEATKIALETSAVSVVTPQSSVSSIASNATTNDEALASANALSGIEGTVKVKPCLETDPACSGNATTVIVKNAKGMVTETTVPSNNKFVVFLDPGTYTLSPSASSLSFTPQTVIVQDKMMSAITLTQ